MRRILQFLLKFNIKQGYLQSYEFMTLYYFKCSVLEICTFFLNPGRDGYMFINYYRNDEINS